MKRFVIHRHEAEKAGLHHDIRLEYKGVLQSWAIPKLLPQDDKKRLAIKVEDHSLKWIDMEGRIKEGYGKGNVYIFDTGVYYPIFRSDFKIVIGLRGRRINEIYTLKLMEDNKWLIYKWMDK